MATVYVKKSATGSSGQNYSGDPYLGNYAAGRATLTVSGGPSQYRIDIVWSSSYNEHAAWSFTGQFGTNGVMYYSGCTKKIVTYTDEIHHTDTVVYTDGIGTLSYVNGTMVWTDYRENVASALTFTKY